MNTVKNLEAMKSVYCYFFPEVRHLLREVERKVPDKLFLVTTPAAEVAESLDGLFPGFNVPATSDGYVNVDMIHVPVIERLVAAYRRAVPDLGGFGFRYPTSGSNEGIFHILAKLRSQGVEQITVLKGEYEGYGIQAANLGINVRELDLEEALEAEPGYWCISNPSARDGNILPEGFVSKLCDLGSRVVLDLAYVGSTEHRQFDVGHENITHLVMSLSKPFGLFRYRIGFAFSRDEMPTLYGNKWFKDTIRLFQGLRVVETFGTDGLTNLYKPVQRSVVAAINEETGLGIVESDALLIAHITKENALGLNDSQRDLIEPFRRAGSYRFCLTPYFEKEEKAK